MGNHWRSSFLRDLLKLFIQFMGVALCSIPATLGYFLVLNAGASDNWAMAISLFVGFSCALLLWRFLDSRIGPKSSHLEVTVEKITATASDLARDPMTTSVMYDLGHGPHLATELSTFTVALSGVPYFTMVEVSQPSSIIQIKDVIVLTEGLDVAA